MKKIHIVSIGLLFISISSNLYASLASNATLLFDPSIEGCPSGGTPPNCDFGLYPVIIGGTFFSFDINGNNNIELNERFGMIAKDGIIIGTSQPASGSHSGYPDGSEISSIEEPWQFFANTGMHQSNSPVTIVSDDNAGNVLLDMSGWGITWNGIPNIPFGSGSWGSNPEGQAILTCGLDCSAGDTFTLFYTAAVPMGDPSGFGGVRYRLGFDGGLAGAALNGVALSAAVSTEDSDLGAAVTGIIGASVVPVPPAIWLFGSGLIGLIGFARRKARA
jgi:hypothetical protein